MQGEDRLLAPRSVRKLNSTPGPYVYVYTVVCVRARLIEYSAEPYYCV